MSRGSSTVGGDAYINGNAKGGTLAIQKTLYQSPGATNIGVTYANLVRTAITVPPPCTCAASDLIPVAGIGAARQTANDNAATGLDPALFTKASPPQRLDLPCGSYYLNSLNTSGPTTIVAHGRTALCIGGDIVGRTALTLTRDPGAELDLFVGGTIMSFASLNIGSPNYPALSRTCVGSTSQLRFSASVSPAGNFYDGTALVEWSAPAAVYGAVSPVTSTHRRPSRSTTTARSSARTPRAPAPAAAAAAGRPATHARTATTRPVWEASARTPARTARSAARR